MTWQEHETGKGSLTPDELELLLNYRSLNDDGKREIQRHAKYVAAQEEYQPIIKKKEGNVTYVRFASVEWIV